MVEFNIGHQLSSMFLLKHRNNYPHALRPSTFYSCALAICRKYRLTFDQLCKNSIKTLYRAVIAQWLPRNVPSPTCWANVHHPILTNYLKTFNYRGALDNLALSSKFSIYTPGSDAACTFCGCHAETLSHLFLDCPMVQPVWQFATAVLLSLTAHTLVPSHELCFNLKVPDNLLLFADHIVLLVTATKYVIWKSRNESRYDGKTATSCPLVKRVKRSVHHRLTIEKRSTAPIYTDTHPARTLQITLRNLLFFFVFLWTPSNSFNL